MNSIDMNVVRIKLIFDYKENEKYKTKKIKINPSKDKGFQINLSDVSHNIDLYDNYIFDTLIAKTMRVFFDDELVLKRNDIKKALDNKWILTNINVEYITGETKNIELAGLGILGTYKYVVAHRYGSWIITKVHMNAEQENITYQLLNGNTNWKQNIKDQMKG